MVRTSVLAWIAVMVCGLARAADPLPQSPPKKLAGELEALQKERKEAVDESNSDPSTERLRLKAQLMDLIRRLGDKQRVEAGGSSTSKPREEPKPPPVPFTIPENGTAIDTLRMGMNLFKSGDVDAAYRAFKLLDDKGIASEDRLYVQYMMACCLRKVGKLSEAATLYREVSENKEDTFLKESALWHLGMMKTTQELETQLEQLRSRRKAK